MSSTRDLPFQFPLLLFILQKFSTALEDFLIGKRKGGCSIYFFRLKYNIYVIGLGLNISSTLSVGKHSCTLLLRQDRGVVISYQRTASATTSKLAIKLALL